VVVDRGWSCTGIYIHILIKRIDYIHTYIHIHTHAHTYIHIPLPTDLEVGALEGDAVHHGVAKVRAGEVRGLLFWWKVCWLDWMSEMAARTKPTHIHTHIHTYTHIYTYIL
jgi:hypothetical protein